MLAFHEVAYVSELREVYAEKCADDLSDASQIGKYPEFGAHFKRQRFAFYAAESIRMDARDAVPEGTCVHEPQPVGLAHFRPFERPLHGSVDCYLDDLFVEERWRGRGNARALLEHLSRLADLNGWTTVRWTTREDNPAQQLYDILASRAPVITCTMHPASDHRG